MVIPGDDLLPVIFFLHGGGYFFGSSDLWGPAYLLDRDVILVTVNFRQGVLGFFSTGDDAAPGNFGLKDQALALKWIVNNIEHFGGDPRRITHMGVASGASIANLNLISKQTRGEETWPIKSAFTYDRNSVYLNWMTFCNFRSCIQHNSPQRLSPSPLEPRKPHYREFTKGGEPIRVQN